jgi:hypothetical protein
MLPRALPALDQAGRVADEPLSGRREPRPRLVADEECSPELLFERPDARADCRLRQMQALGRRDEAAAVCNF